MRAESRSLALAITASVLASSALAGCDSSASRGAARLAPDCAPAVTAPRQVDWDPEGCWENRPGGSRVFRTTWGGHHYYYASPPNYSRYASEPSSHGGWFSGRSSGAHSAAG
jgi:hypothetical protein